MLAVNRLDGKIVWQRTVRELIPNEGIHYTGSFASNSPVVDGEHLFAFFGSYGLYSLDLDGELLWETDLGDMQTKHGHGEGGSPVLHGDTLIINWDHEGQSFVVAFDKRTGKQRWKVERDEPTSWATPVVVEHGGKHQVIISGTKRVRGYELDTGRVIWECAGLSANIVCLAGGRGRHGLCRQQLRHEELAGHTSRRRQGRHHRNQPGRVDAK